MHTANRLVFSRWRVAIVAVACSVVPVLAKDSAGPQGLAERELQKRRAAVEEAQELLGNGDQAYQAGRFGDAVTAFSGARELLPDTELTADLRAATTQRLVQASIAQARSLSRKGDVAAAIAVMDAVLDAKIAANDPAAQAMRKQLDDPIRTNPALTKKHTADVEKVRNLLYSAEGAYNLGKFNEAKTLYENVLRVDSTNSAARRGLEQIAATKSNYQKTAADHTRAELLTAVDAAWETTTPPPLTDIATVDPGLSAQANPFIPVSNKIDRIFIPNIILENATLLEAIDLLRLRAAELDQIELDPTRRGVNFHVDLGDESSEIGNKIRAIHFNLRLAGVPVSQALRYINEQTQTMYTTDDFSVVIRPRGSDSKVLVTRTYRVTPDFLNALGNSGAATKTEDPFAAKAGKSLLTERRGAQEVLHEQGVQFPEGASASLNPVNNTLLVVNTAANQDIISQIVEAAIKTEPVMVCTRVTMIRIQESRLKELGFDWLLSPTGFGGAGWTPGTEVLNFSGGVRGNGGDLSDVPVPAGQSDRNPVTAGNRSGDSAAYKDSIDTLIKESTMGRTSQTDTSYRAPGILAVSNVLTGKSVEMLMRGLQQQKGVDIMTAASTISRNGQASNVRSTREMYYASSYEPPQLPNNVGVGNGGAMPVTPSTPSSFEKREVGFIIEVTPTADDTKRYIDLALNPSVVEFDGFVNYGSPINTNVPSGVAGVNGIIGTTTTQLSRNQILMPVFSTQRLNTSLTVADGATIVIGGLLKDRVHNINDKTPIFGDIPLVGRLFQSKVYQPISTAVVFLVNVQIMDPTGRPYNKR